MTRSPDPHSCFGRTAVLSFVSPFDWRFLACCRSWARFRLVINWLDW